MTPAQGILRRVACAGVMLLAARASARAQEFRLFPQGSTGLRQGGVFASPGAAELRIFDRLRPFPSSAPTAPDPGRELDSRYDFASPPEPPPGDAMRHCVLLQCVEIPEGPPPKKLFTTPVALWTATALFGGLAVGLDGPIDDGFHHLSFTDEGYFQTWTYAGGADKVSHFVFSADIAGVLSDAYRLNRLSPNQAFALSFATALMAGLLVEVGDGLTPYGFSAQDLTADALGALSGALVKRHHLDDLISFRLGKVPTTIPPEVRADHVFLGVDYATEIYTADLKLEGLSRRLRLQPGIGRYLLFSFAFLTKGYGFNPPLPDRYQEIGLEVGLNFPEILRAIGLRSSTWWGDLLLRTFDFLRIPFTQAGIYYNLANRTWYGPGAPNRFH